MLTKQQIQTIQSTKQNPGGTTTGGFNAPQNAPMDDNAFKQWSSGTAQPKSPSSNPVSDFVSSIIPSVGSLAGTAKTNTENQQKSSFNSIGTDISSGAADTNAGNEAFSKGNIGEGLKQTGKALVQGGLGTVSDAISYFLAPLSGGVKTAVDTVSGANPNAAGISDIPAVQKLATGPAGDAVSNAQNVLEKAAKANPTLAKALTDAFNVATTAVGGFEAPEAVNDLTAGTAKDITTVGDKASSVVNSIKEKIPVGNTETPDTLIPESGKVSPESARASAWKDIQPNSTPSTRLAYAKQGNTTPQGMFTSGKLTPSSADAKLLDSYEKLYSDGTVKDNMTPQQKQTAVQQKAAQLNGQQKEFLATHDKAVTLSDAKTKTGLFDKLDSLSKKSSLPFSKDPATKGAYDSVIETYKSLLSTGQKAGTVKGASTITKIDSALTALDSEMSKFKAWGTTKTGEVTDTGLARQQAIRDVHTWVRDYIAEQLPPNSPWKSIRLEESNMYQIGDRLAQRSADTVGTSKVGSFIKKNPVAKAGVNAVAGATGAGAALHLIP